MKILPGSIWVLDLDPIRGNEQGGTRPCLVMSSSRHLSEPVEMAIIVPLTSRDRGIKHHVLVRDNGGLNTRTFAMTEQPRTVNLTPRLGRYVGMALPTTVGDVARWLRRFQQQGYRRKTRQSG